MMIDEVDSIVAMTLRDVHHSFIFGPSLLSHWNSGQHRPQSTISLNGRRGELVLRRRIFWVFRYCKTSSSSYQIALFLTSCSTSAMASARICFWFFSSVSPFKTFSMTDFVRSACSASLACCS